MFLSKYFGPKPSESSKTSVCILQLTYDFEERLHSTNPSLPVISSQVMISGLTLDLREQMTLTFPQAQHNQGEEVIFLQLEETDPKKAYVGIGTLPKVMKSVTDLLTFLVSNEFKIVTCTVDSSSSGGYATKSYCWTLQQNN